MDVKLVKSRAIGSAAVLPRSLSIDLICSSKITLGYLHLDKQQSLVAHTKLPAIRCDSIYIATCR